jgi:hypothetical protein
MRSRPEIIAARSAARPPRPGSSAREPSCRTARAHHASPHPIIFFNTFFRMPLRYETFVNDRLRV